MPSSASEGALWARVMRLMAERFWSSWLGVYDLFVAWEADRSLVV